MFPFWKSTRRRGDQQAQPPQASAPTSDEHASADIDEAWSCDDFRAGASSPDVDLGGGLHHAQDWHGAVPVSTAHARGVAGGPCALGEPKLVEDTAFGSSSSFEMILWRLSELEAKVLNGEAWEGKVDAALADFAHSKQELRQRVLHLEVQLGLPKRGFRDRLPARYADASVWIPKERRPSGEDGDLSEPGTPGPSPTPIGRRTSSSLDAGPTPLTPHSQQSQSQSSFVLTFQEPGSFPVSPDQTGAYKEGGIAQLHSSSNIASNAISSNHKSNSSNYINAKTNTSTSDSNSNSIVNNNNSSSSSAKVNGAANGSSQSPQKAAKKVLNNFKTALAISSTSVHEVFEVEADTDRTLSPTVWNAAFLIGMNRTGFLASALITFLLFLNVAMQSVFLGVISHIVASELFDANEIERLRSWRIFIAHSVNHYDKMSQTSLSQRVCAAADSTSTLPVEMSDSKAALVESIKDYLPAETPLFSGPSLSVIAIAFWSLKVISEMLDIWDTFHGMRAIPRGQRNILLESPDGGFRLANLTLCHKIFVNVILAARLTICLSLWTLGIDFLVNYSIEPAELILNAVALEIVLSVDEVLFVLVPASCKTFMARLEPLPKTRSVRQWSGVDLRSILLTGLLVLVVSLIYIGRILPLLDRIYEAQSVLCDGTRNFIVAVDPFMYVFTTATEGGGQEMDINSATTTAIEELLYPATSPTRTLLGISGQFAMAANILAGDGTSELVQISTMTMQEAGEHFQAVAGRSCGDLFIGRETFFLKEYMNSAFGAEVNNCSQMEKFCNQDSFVRASCPTTCGCDIPFGDAFDIGATGGCPAKCLEGSGRWGEQLATRECEDIPVATLSTSQAWQEWGVQFSKGLDSIMQGYEELFGAVCDSHDGNCTKMFIELGCDFVPIARTVFSSLEGDPCTGDWLGEVIDATWKPLGPICPVSCNCLSNPNLTISTGLPACPTSCSLQPTTTVTATSTTTSLSTTTSTLDVEA